MLRCATPEHRVKYDSMSEQVTNSRRYLHLRGAADTASIRLAQFMGREHVVVPVVALIGGAVVRPMGSKGPEYVPEEELSLVPGSWNGRPVVPDHPLDGSGAPVSASASPQVLEANQFGVVHNARYEDGRLKMDAYICPERAQELGGDALSVLTRAQAGEDVEVSVGAWVYADEESGISPKGLSYQYVWREIVPDHLAMLPEGVEGACSVEMGCGAPRIARKDTMAEKNKKTRELRAAKVRFSASITHREMRDWLESELASAESGAGWIWVVDVDQDEGFVVYEMSSGDEPEKTYRRSFSVSGDELSLASEREEVRIQAVYISAAGESDEPGEISRVVYNTTDGGETLSVDESMTTASTNTECSCRKDKPMADNTETAVDKLIAASASPFTEDHREQLTALGASALKNMSARYLSEEPDPVSTPEPAVDTTEPAQSEPVVDPDVVQLSKEEHETLTAMANAYQADLQAKKNTLVASLKGAQDAYTEDELNDLSLEALQKVSKLCKVEQPVPAVDFSARGLTSPPGADQDLYMNPPDPYDLAIAKRDGVGGAN